MCIFWLFSFHGSFFAASSVFADFLLLLLLVTVLLVPAIFLAADASKSCAVVGDCSALTLMFVLALFAICSARTTLVSFIKGRGSFCVGCLWCCHCCNHGQFLVLGWRLGTWA